MISQKPAKTVGGMKAGAWEGNSGMARRRKTIMRDLKRAFESDLLGGGVKGGKLGGGGAAAAAAIGEMRIG